MNGNNEELKNCLEEIDETAKFIADNNLLEINRKLILYCAIRASSVLESSFKGIIFDRLSAGCNEETKNYLKNEIIDSSSNPSPVAISSLLKKINNDWATEFEKKVGFRKSKEYNQLWSLVNIRNAFNHREVPIVDSIDDIREYFLSGIKVIEILDEIVSS